MTASPTWGHSDDRFVPTPASHEKPPWVAVFGAGIAGLTAAHELAERGFNEGELRKLLGLNFLRVFREVAG